MSREATKDLQKITDRRWHKCLDERIQGLTCGPHLRGCPLSGGKPKHRRMRVGKYRVIYIVHKLTFTTEIVKIALKKEGPYKEINKEIN